MNEVPDKVFLRTTYGAIIHGDCLDVLSELEPATVDLVMTSPPFGLVRKKDYGNVASEDYNDWFRAFGMEFHRMLTDPGDVVIDPFGGSCVTGEVCERLERQWTCIELIEDYCNAAKGRFVRPPLQNTTTGASEDGKTYYQLPHPRVLWKRDEDEPLADDGGKSRPKKAARTRRATRPGTQMDLM